MSDVPPPPPELNEHEAQAEEIIPFLPPAPDDLPVPETELNQDEGEAAAAAAAAAAVGLAAEEAAVAAVVVADGEAAAAAAITEDLKKINERQHDQMQLIVNMQSMINDLSAKQSELEDEIRDLKGGRWVVKAEPKHGHGGGGSRSRRGDYKDGGRGVTHSLLSVGAAGSGIEGNTDDHEIDAIIRARVDKKMWPLKRKYCATFTNEVDFLKIRFHRSVNHDHKSVRIPKIDKAGGYGLGNKEGRLICRLCSGKTINRNTSWMCATCCVPLCVDITNGDAETSCHARWHACQDLVAVNQMLNSALREKRESKKRSRESMNRAEVSAEAIRAAAAMAPPDACHVVEQKVEALASATIPPPEMEAAEMAPPEMEAVEMAQPKVEIMEEMAQPKVEIMEEMSLEQEQVQLDPKTTDIDV